MEKLTGGIKILDTLWLVMMVSLTMVWAVAGVELGAKMAPFRGACRG